LFVVLLAYCGLILHAFVLMPGVVDSALAEAGRITPAVIVLGELPFAVVALLGVGLGVRRTFREAFARLGYGPITLPQLGIVALFVVGALLLSYAADAIFAVLQPDLFERVGKISEGLFSPEGLSPVSAVLFALLIGVGAGLGEETLFRGAVQPVLGITPTSILFASVHIQYGPSLLLVYLFVISVGLGLLRKHINTTASFLAHAGYNSLGVLLAYFFGL
jgi:membrane protease YdiL (CAAX protease family)